jgi:hypothetical protein
MTGDTHLTYLNVDLYWPDFSLVNLERGADGGLTLTRVLRFVEELGAAQVTLSPGSSPAAALSGIAADHDGNLYVSDPLNQRVWRFDACARAAAPLSALQGTGPRPGQVDAPRGLAVGSTPSGPRLYVADSGNHRIQVIDLLTQQVIAVWGPPDPYAPPVPGAGPGRLNDPRDLAADAAGSVYVVDHGNARVQKFTFRGRVDESFAAALAAQPNRPQQPERVAVAGGRVYVLDHAGAPWRVVVFDTQGRLQSPGAWDVAQLANPVGLAATTDAVYLGDAGGTIVAYDPDGQVRGIPYELGRPLAANSWT